jgi:hypothetical protein
MKVDICINKFNNDAYMCSYSMPGWTSPMSFSAHSEKEAIEVVKKNIRQMLAQGHIKMYTLNFPDIEFPVITDKSIGFSENPNQDNIARASWQDDIPKKKRGRPPKNKTPDNTALKPKTSALKPKKANAK